LSSTDNILVSNFRLCCAALETGLDKFIIKEPFTGRKWRPPYVEDLLEVQEPPKREMSTKVLADVVEALIGASMVDGGISKALLCLQIFLPESDWLPLEEQRLTLYNHAPDTELPTTLQPLEELIGYAFNKKSLLIEAMTHGSYIAGAQSLERSEFLGDR
jgi:dsRNA-specific ribonuclease